MAFTVLAVLAVRPAASLAAPVEPELAFEPGSYDFGLQPVDQDGSQTTLQLRNNGDETVGIESLEIAGSGSESFWFGSSNCGGAWLQPGESCSAQVYFSPRDVSEYAVQLRARSNSYEFSANLSGGGASPYLVPDSNPVDFGISKVGSAGNTREITIANAGNWPGGVFIAVISGGAVASYQLLDENCTNRVLFPADECTVQVRFRPLGEGVKKATLALFGESDGGTQVTLTGTGAAPDPDPDPEAQTDSAPVAVPSVVSGAVASHPVDLSANVARHRGRARKAKARRLRARKARVQRAVERRRRAHARRLRHRSR